MDTGFQDAVPLRTKLWIGLGVAALLAAGFGGSLLINSMNWGENPVPYKY